MHHTEMLSHKNCALALIDYQPAMYPIQRLIQAGAVPITSLQWSFELQQDWARSEPYEGMMDILKAHSPYGIQVRFSKWALGAHASEGVRS